MTVFALLCLVGAAWVFRKHIQSAGSNSSPNVYNNLVEDSNLHLLQLPHIGSATDANSRHHQHHPQQHRDNVSHAKAISSTSSSLLHTNAVERGGDEGEEEEEEEGDFETFNL